jgi:hypothetical protein
MSAFVVGFVHAVVERLVASGELELAPGTEARVAAFVGARVADGKPRSLVSAVGEALVACPDVVEVFADDERLKEVIDEVGEWLRAG